MLGKTTFSMLCFLATKKLRKPIMEPAVIVFVDIDSIPVITAPLNSVSSKFFITVFPRSSPHWGINGRSN